MAIANVKMNLNEDIKMVWEIVNFTENITPKKWIMKPFVGIYLKKQQATYISDLRKALEEKQ